jgi:hypothetical protein
VLLLHASARAADADAVRRSIDRGVAHLKRIQQQDGRWPRQELGATALAGLTLLECGVAADDPAVQRAAAVVRDGSVTQTQTYSLALAILFLDQLGEPVDVALIESMAVRLLAGQNSSGGWSYECPPIANSEVQRLQAVLKTGGKDLPRTEPGARREAKDLPREIQQQLDLVNRQNVLPQVAVATGADNSNTQFAILALWAARRQGIPVDRALARVEARFRACQNPDGGWSYSPLLEPGAAAIPGGDSTPAMTCAGLLGLAAAHAAAAEAAGRRDPNKPAAGARDLNKDINVKAGLLAVGSVIDLPAGRLAQIPPGALEIPVLGAGDANGKGYYFLWSLERVAVAYGLDTIANKDWYAWGAEIVLANQNRDGGWRGEYGDGGVDTCFALLFLRKANLAKDLTAALKGRVKDPDERELKAGGVGGTEFIKKIGLKPAFAKDEKASGTKPPAPSPRPADGEAARLADELVGAQGAGQEKVLEKLRDSKGAAYTDALALAIPKLIGPVKTRARDALAERLTRMTAATLKEKLKDDELEIRRAAALACAMKEQKEHVPRLIELLEDPEPPVARAAHAALKSLTGQDFGPAADASRAEVKKCAAAWKAWWAKNGSK